jgi:hypothetical protein
MKTLAALLCLLPLGAFAASPEEDYLAARDRYIAQFKLQENEPITDAISKAEEQARAALEKQMQAIIGPSGVKGAPAQGKLNLDSLISGDMGFGLLDGLVFKLGGGAQVLVTTRTLLARWIAAEQAIWKDSPEHGFPAEIDAALRAENFYTQALSHDAAVTHYADIPVTGGVAMLITHRQDIGPSVPRELIVAVLTGERLFIWSAPARAKVVAIPQCSALWTAAERKAKALEKKSRDNVDQAEKLRADADTAMRQCFNERAKSQAFFPALVNQARELVERVR